MCVHAGGISGNVPRQEMGSYHVHSVLPSCHFCSMSYSLQLIDIPSVCFIDKPFDVKVAVLHKHSGGVGRDKNTSFQLAVSYKDAADSIPVFEVIGDQVVTRKGIQIVQLRFHKDTVPSEVSINAICPDAETSPTIMMRLIRYQLKVKSFHNGSVFYSQSFGKYSHIKLTVGVVDKDDRVARDISIPLSISLRYRDSDNEVVSCDGPLINTFGLSHVLEQGYALIPLRIEDVSSNHQNQDFVIHVSALDPSRYADVNGASSTSIHVKAKLRPLDPALTPPKFKLSSYQQELQTLRSNTGDSFIENLQAMCGTGTPSVIPKTRKKGAGLSADNSKQSEGTLAEGMCPTRSSTTLDFGHDDDDMVDWEVLEASFGDFGIDDENDGDSGGGKIEWGDSFFATDV